VPDAGTDRFEPPARTVHFVFTHVTARPHMESPEPEPLDM
jgi:hypothetical protein